MNMPSGGKLLSAAESARLAMCDNVDRSKLIEAIVFRLQVQQMGHDKRSATWRERWSAGKLRRGKRRSGR